MDVSNAFATGPSGAAGVLTVGYVVVFAGLVIQRWRAEAGLAVVAAGLTATAASLAGLYVLAYLTVCYEAWFISGFVRRRRGMWLTLLLVGSVSAAVVVTVMTGVGWAWGAAAVTSGPDGADGAVFVPSVSQFVIAGSVFSLLAVISIGLFWQLGLTTRRQHERMESLAARAELAAVEERTRIAREMHDIVAHSLTAVIAQADGGRYAGRQDPDRAIEALDTISGTGRNALAQMRQLLSVLRDDAADGARETTAPPGVGGVAVLVDDARHAGVDVNYRVLGQEVDLDAVDAAVGLTVYRTVQECLTNVLKHAGPTRATVTLDWTAPGRVHVRGDNAPGDGLVTSASAGDGPGQGLVGVRERASIHGGRAYWGESRMYVGGWCVDVDLAV